MTSLAAVKYNLEHNRVGKSELHTFWHMSQLNDLISGQKRPKTGKIIIQINETDRYLGIIK